MSVRHGAQVINAVPDMAAAVPRRTLTNASQSVQTDARRRTGQGAGDASETKPSTTAEKSSDPADDSKSYTMPADAVSQSKFGSKVSEGPRTLRQKLQKMQQFFFKTSLQLCVSRGLCKSKIKMLGVVMELFCPEIKDNNSVCV